MYYAMLAAPVAARGSGIRFTAVDDFQKNKSRNGYGVGMALQCGVTLL